METLHGYTDLDELILRCRDHQSRRYIREAVACYNAGAYRSCIITTWIAVSFDFVHKLRDLSVSGAGDANATKKLSEFQKYRETEDFNGALAFERDILGLAKDQFEFITPQEYRDLVRLQEDRNRCAHPSMSSNEASYEPTAELARYHLRNAVEHMLANPPVQGKAALNLIWDLIGSAYFPISEDDALIQLQNSALQHARKPLIKNVIMGITKTLILDNKPSHEKQRLVAALRAVERMYPAEFKQTLEGDLAKTFERTSDDSLIDAIIYLEKFPGAWEYLHEGLRTKMESYVLSVNGTEASTTLASALSLEPLKLAAHRRLKELSFQMLGEVVKRVQNVELAEAVVARLEMSTSFEESNGLTLLVLPQVKDVLTADQIVRLVVTRFENGQVGGAYRVPPFISSVFTTREDIKEALKTGFFKLLDSLEDQVNLEQINPIAAHKISEWIVQHYPNEHLQTKNFLTVDAEPDPREGMPEP